MSRLKNLKPNEVKVLLEKYVHVLIGLRKTGKTTLFKDLVYEHYNGDMSKGLLLGFEKGYQALDGLYAEDINSWKDFEDITDELIEDRDNLPYRLIGIDTIDEMVNMAEEETIRYYNRKTGQKASTINEAGGGFGRGKKYAKSLIRDSINKLLKSGFGIVFIGHSKLKTIKESEDIEYNQLSCSLTEDYGDIFMDMADLITFLTIDKEIEGKIARKTVVMNFRSDGFIDCGGRFKNLPEKVTYGAKAYLNVFEEAIKSSMLKPVDNMDKIKAEQRKTLEENAKDFRETVSNEKHVEKIKEVFPTLNDAIKEEVYAIMNKYNIKTFTDPQSLDREGLIQIVKLLG